ncbi:MAG: hypothetical protein KatS3mg097_304 [Candidatus Parcubacteria bacterium]|nr:MAG: hypothetical protein KatS3mg097_304 [Candidatus Parcubacteria bacterium]
MPDLLPPYQLIDCSDILSCFQSIYNLLVILLIAFSFLLFVFGAFQYILSAANIFSIGEAKNRMKNSLTALIIGLVFSSLMYYINPNIFKVNLFIPKVNMEMPPLIGDEQAVNLNERKETELFESTMIENVRSRFATTVVVSPAKPTELQNWRFDSVFSDVSLTNISILGNDCWDDICKNDSSKATEYVNPALKNHIKTLNDKLQEKGVYAKITDGYSAGDHSSKSHTVFGTAIDLIIVDESGKKLPPDDERWQKAIEASLESGFFVLDERRIKGSKDWTGSHLHIFTKTKPMSR